MAIGERVAANATNLAYKSKKSVENDSRYQLSKLAQKLGVSKGGKLDDVYKELKKAIGIKFVPIEYLEEMFANINAFGKALDAGGVINVPFVPVDKVYSYSLSLQILLNAMIKNGDLNIPEIKSNMVIDEIGFSDRGSTDIYANKKIEDALDLSVVNNIYEFINDIISKNASELFQKLGINTNWHANINTGDLQQFVGTNASDWKEINSFISVDTNASTTEVDLARKILYKVILTAQETEEGISGLIRDNLCGFHFPVLSTCKQTTNKESDQITPISANSALYNVFYVWLMFSRIDSMINSSGITIPSGFPNIHDTVRNVIEASKEFQIKEAHKSTSLDDIMPILTPIVGSEMASIISRAANEGNAFPTTAVLKAAIVANMQDTSLPVMIAKNIDHYGGDLLDFTGANTNTYMPNLVKSASICSQYKFYSSMVNNKCGVSPEPASLTGGTLNGASAETIKCVDAAWNLTKAVLKLTTCGKDVITAAGDTGLAACKGDIAEIDLYSHILDMNFDPDAVGTITTDMINC